MIHEATDLMFDLLADGLQHAAIARIHCAAKHEFLPHLQGTFV